MDLFKINLWFCVLLLLALSKRIKSQGDDDWAREDDATGQKDDYSESGDGKGALIRRKQFKSTELPDCSVSGKFYPHKSDCNKYYWCYFGKANVQHCTIGTVWDVKLNQCNWPDQADRTDCS